MRLFDALSYVLLARRRKALSAINDQVRCTRLVRVSTLVVSFASQCALGFCQQQTTLAARNGEAVEAEPFHRVKQIDTLPRLKGLLTLNISRFDLTVLIDKVFTFAFAFVLCNAIAVDRRLELVPVV